MTSAQQDRKKAEPSLFSTSRVSFPKESFKSISDESDSPPSNVFIVQVNVMRAIILNATPIFSKGYVVDATGWQRNNFKTACCSSFLAGFFMTVTVSPFDRVRTALMNQPTNAKLYEGMTDCLVKTVRNEGILSLWKGFIPIWARFAPMVTLQLLTIEFLYASFGFKSI